MFEIRQGKVGVVVATGPSLERRDAEAVCKASESGWVDFVIGVNDAYRILPRLDHLYAADAKWWRHHIESVRGSENCASAELWTCQFPAGVHRPDQEEILAMEGMRGVTIDVFGEGLGRDIIVGGSNSGYQAVNLAYNFGAEHIILLGFDMKRPVFGGTHFFGEHPPDVAGSPDFDHFIDKFEQLSVWIERHTPWLQIVNCTRDTRLSCFERMPLEKAIADAAERRTRIAV